MTVLTAVSQSPEKRKCSNHKTYKDYLLTCNHTRMMRFTCRTRVRYTHPAARTFFGCDLKTISCCCLLPGCWAVERGAGPLLACCLSRAVPWPAVCC